MERLLKAIEREDFEIKIEVEFKQGFNSDEKEWIFLGMKKAKNKYDIFEYDLPSSSHLKELSDGVLMHFENILIVFKRYRSEIRSYESPEKDAFTNFLFPKVNTLKKIRQYEMDLEFGIKAFSIRYIVFQYMYATMVSFQKGLVELEKKRQLETQRILSRVMPNLKFTKEYDNLVSHTDWVISQLENHSPTSLKEDFRSLMKKHGIKEEDFRRISTYVAKS
jgi:hypothetical protein